MIQDNINKLLMYLGVVSTVSKNSNKSNEMAKKAEDSLKENAQAKINQKTTFEEYKSTIYEEKKED